MSSDELRQAERASSEAPDGGKETESPPQDELQAELAILRERNQQLQESYVQARQTQYRRTALGLAGLGAVATAGAWFVPGVRDLLLVLGAIGLFGGILTYFLTPEQFVSESVGTAVYKAVADDRATMIEELGLLETQIYVPIGEYNNRVRLFVPQVKEYSIPADDELETIYIVPESDDNRGVSFRPTGDALFQAFEEALSGPLGETPARITTQATDALVEQFDLVGETAVDLDEQNGRVTIGVQDALYGSVTQIDHPVTSFLAVSFAKGLGVPVSVEVREAADSRVDFQVTCRWEGESDEPDEI